MSAHEVEELKRSLRAAVEACSVIGEAVRDHTKLSPLGGIPSGHLWAQLMSIMSFELYEQMIQTLKDGKMIVEDQSHLLRWVGGDQ